MVPFLVSVVLFASLGERTRAQTQASGADVPLPAAIPAPPLPQPPPPLPQVESEDATLLPRVPLAEPRPLQGPTSARSFIQSLSTKDAAFEVVIGQARILTTQEDISAGQGQALIAVGDPSVIEFTVVNPRQIRVVGLRIGVTDLSVTTSRNQTFSFEVRVVADLSLLRSRLRATFPDTSLQLTQIRDHIIVEGEARDTGQVNRILQMISAYLRSVYGSGQRTTGGGAAQPAPAAGYSPTQPSQAVGPEPVPGPPTPVAPGTGLPGTYGAYLNQGFISPEINPLAGVIGAGAPPELINLIRIPTSQQVMLKVRVAELNRTGFRQIGANLIGAVPGFKSVFGTVPPGNAPTAAAGALTSKGLQIVNGSIDTIGTGSQAILGPNTTAFGIFQGANFEFLLSALRRNSLLKILAEPNLIALSGHQASFLAGGEFPVPVPQTAGGTVPVYRVLFKEFGVRLGFVPYILDGELIRLSVAPEVSEIDFTIAVTLVPGGNPVPGLNTRKAQTTVELRQGQTLAIAGLLQIELDGSTQRLPGLGDLPILGPFFSNTTGQRIEKELVVLVTPYLVEPMNPGQVPPGPGDEVKEPNDLEFFLLNRFESRTGVDFRSTTQWDDPLHLIQVLKLEKKHVYGPSGFSE
jgi:pilus assembly protein CpaC